MAQNTTMTYGSYSFSPVPFLDIQKTYAKTGDSAQIGSVFAVTLTGTLTPVPNTTGIVEIDILIDALRTAFATEGSLFEVKCGATTLISAHPRINDISFNRTNNNWVQTCDFTISIEWDDEPTSAGEDSTLMPPYLSAATENWEVQFFDDKFNYDFNLDGGVDDANPYMLRLTHNVSATGKRHYITDGGTGGTLEKPAWEWARDYVIPRLGYNSECISASGVLNLDASTFQEYNHVRTKQLDEPAGTFNVTESWVVINPSGAGVAGRALEDFTVNVNTSLDTGQTTVSIEGSIVGLETKNFGTNPGDFTISETKYAAASGYWGTVQTKLLGRAQLLGNGTATRDINPAPMSTTVGHNPPAGTITYSYSYNDRPCNFISNSLNETITVTDNHPTDVFAELVVLGRARGPILQEMSTVTKSTRTVAIDVVVQPPTGCTTGDLSAILAAKPTGDVTTLLCAFENELTSVYNQVFKSADSESWNPKTGQYTRNVTWDYVNCTGPAPATSFC